MSVFRLSICSYNYFPSSHTNYYQQANNCTCTSGGNKMPSISIISRCMHCLHAFVDPMSPLSFRGRCISPRIRWVGNSVLAIPHFYYALWKIIRCDAIGVKLYYTIVIVLLMLAIKYMRLVILSFDEAEYVGIEKILLKPDCDNDCSVKTARQSRSDRRDMTLKGCNGIHYCSPCDWSYELRDHHCGAFGTCIHAKNRIDYIRFCCCGAVVNLMFVPDSVGFVLRQWEWRVGTGGLLGGLLSSLWKALPSLLVLNCTAGLSFFLMMCYLQQLSFEIYKEHVRSREYRARGEDAPPLEYPLAATLVSMLFSSPREFAMVGAGPCNSVMSCSVDLRVYGGQMAYGGDELRAFDRNIAIYYSPCADSAKTEKVLEGDEEQFDDRYPLLQPMELGT